MQEQVKNKEPGDYNRIQDARIGYQVAASLWTYEGNLLVSKFTAMLLANSIVLATLILVRSNGSLVSGLAIAIPIAGLVLCALWLVMAKRGFDNYSYWIKTTREIEEKFFSDAVTTVSRGGHFADGDPVHLTIESKPTELRMSWLGRRLKVSRIWYIMICVFGTINVLFLVWR